MKKTGWKWACLALACLAPGLARAANLEITSFTGKGEMTWTYWTPGLQGYRIEWASNLMSNKWTDLAQSMHGVAPTDATMTVEVPMFFRIKAQINPPANMAYIPAGTFRMGDTFAEGSLDERPVHDVYVGGFYLDQYEVTKTLWDSVAAWAHAHNYDIAETNALGKVSSHPVQQVTWYEAVKWCNARSEKEGLAPCYRYYDFPDFYVYRNGVKDSLYINDSGGYRLPTEAEWEKAARGGADWDYRFPWLEDTISHERANYMASGLESYDLDHMEGPHPDWYIEPDPYTNPGGVFNPNGYGLYDMAGNVWEWCWDWYSNGYYNASAAMDPQGPASGTYRVLRGGTWKDHASYARCSCRHPQTPVTEGNHIGFRCARRP